MAAFSFAYNPFVVLPVSLRAGPRDVEDAFQRRLAARPQDEAALTRARRLLLEPDSRLAAEVAWLIDVGPKEAVGLLGAMAGGNQSALLDALAGQPPLTKANVAADACHRLKSAAFLRPLAQAHNGLNSATLLALLNEIHGAIPLAPVNARQLDAALRAIAMLHAGSAMEAISAQVDPAFALATITQGPDAASGAFLDELTRQYEERYPSTPPEPANDDALVEPAPEPASRVEAVGGGFAEVHAPQGEGWGEGEHGAAAAAAAFMDAQLSFSAHERFDTAGNSKNVQRVLYVLGGVAAAVIVILLFVTRNAADDADKAAAAAAANRAAAPAAVAQAGEAGGRHHHHQKPQCITVSGASYCTNE
jgi:hypothetical protein